MMVFVDVVRSWDGMLTLSSLCSQYWVAYFIVSFFNPLYFVILINHCSASFIIQLDISSCRFSNITWPHNVMCMCVLRWLLKKITRKRSHQNRRQLLQLKPSNLSKISVWNHRQLDRDLLSRQQVSSKMNGQFNIILIWFKCMYYVITVLLRHIQQCQSVRPVSFQAELLCTAFICTCVTFFTESRWINIV